MFRLVAIVLLFAAPVLRAASEADQLTAAGITVFTNAYRKWDGAQFAAAAAQFQKACNLPSATATNFYWLGAGEFHRALQILGLPANATNKAAAAAALTNAVAALNHGAKLDATDAETHALLGTIYGMQIGDNSLRALWLGPKVQKEMKAAMAIGTNDARVEYLMGTSQFYCAMREATRREALATLLQAEKLFQIESTKQPAPLEPRWGYDSCLTFIGSSYEKLGHPAEAEQYFRKALGVHPEDGLAQAGLARVTGGAKK